MSLTDCHRGMSLTDCREDDQMVNSSYQGMLTNQMPPLKRVDDEVDADGKQTTRMKKMTKRFAIQIGPAEREEEQTA